MNRYCCHEDNIEESLYEIFSNAGYFQFVHLAVQNSQKQLVILSTTFTHVISFHFRQDMMH